jgi:vacuolar protein sorting-associated protein 26
MSSPVSVSVSLDVPKKNAEYRHPSMPPNVAVYVHGDIIKGRFSIELAPGTSVDHKGVTISLIGAYQGSDCPSKDVFFSKVLQLLPPAKLSQTVKSPFTFDRLPLPVGSYYGDNINLSYFVECSVQKTSFGCKKLFCVVRPEEIHETPLRKGIGITNVLHMEVLLRSTVVDPRIGFFGALHLSLAKIRIVNVQLELIRKERINDYHERLITQFEVLDGATVKGVMIPIRFYTGNLNLWPSPKDPSVNVEYAIRVFAQDEPGEKYVKYLPVSFAFPK